MPGSNSSHPDASPRVLEQPLGLTFPGVFALIARAHMQKHGTTEEQMARHITGWLFDGISRYEDLVPAAAPPSPATRRPAKDTP